MSFFNAKILGTGAFYPQKVVTNHDLAKTLDTSDEWIYGRTGIKERRISTMEGGEFATDLAFKATLGALEEAHMEVDEIDMIMLATFTPDYRLPNCASQLQVMLNMKKHCAAVDLCAACSGFVYGFNMANALIQTGAMRNILIVGTEMLSQAVDWTDRNVCIIFGDGAGAMILGKNEDPEDCSRVYATKLGANGKGRKFLYQDYGGMAKPITPEIAASPERFIKMQGREMFKEAVRTLSDISLAAIDEANVRVEDIDWLIPHQANIRILEATGKRLGIPVEKTIINIEKYANTSAATIPTAFHHGLKDGRIKRGDLILLAAFGAGLTSGATVFRY